MASSVTSFPICFYPKFSFTSPGGFWSRQGLFLPQTHLVKLTSNSNSQAGTRGATPEASCPVASYSGMFILGIHEGFLDDSLPSRAPRCAGPGWLCSLFLMPLMKEQHPPDLAVSHADQTGKQFQAAESKHSHFRKGQAGSTLRMEMGSSLSFSLFYFPSDVRPG